MMNNHEKIMTYRGKDDSGIVRNLADRARLEERGGCRRCVNYPDRQSVGERDKRGIVRNIADRARIEWKGGYRP